MLSKESIKYSLRNLNKNKSRSILTIFSILVGIATIFIFISFGLGLYNYIEELSSSSTADKILINPRTAGNSIGSTGSIILNDDDVDTISKSPGISDATGMYFDSVQVKKDDKIKYVFLASYDPKEEYILDVFSVDIEEGRNVMPGDTNKVVLGYNYLIPNKIFEKPYQVNDKIEVNNQELRVVGFLSEIGNPQDDSQVYITNEGYLEVYPTENSYEQIIAVVENVNQIDRTVEDVERSLRSSRDLEEGKEDFSVQSFNDLIESFSSALNIVIGFVILIASISVLVSTINTANTMITSVLERYKEIGVLKAVGAKNKEIFSIFLFESSFLGFIAGILGCILGWFLSYIGGQILIQVGFSFLQPAFPIYLFLGLILFATLTGGISGVLPAIRASRINPVDALRDE